MARRVVSLAEGRDSPKRAFVCTRAELTSSLVQMRSLLIVRKYSYLYPLLDCNNYMNYNYLNYYIVIIFVPYYLLFLVANYFNKKNN